MPSADQVPVKTAHSTMAAATSAVVASSAAIRPFSRSRVDNPVPGLATAADGK
jgi:hypothetical protein